MSTRILAAIDFSDVSLAALTQAHEVARRREGRLGVVHVLPSFTRTNPIFPQDNKQAALDATELERKVIEGVERLVEKQLGLGPEAFDVFVDTAVEHAGVVARAESWGADLLVVGSHGRTGIRRALLGSVSEIVTRHAHCDVLVARAKPHEGPVLAATDLSDPSLPVLRVAKAEAAMRGVEVCAIHALDVRGEAIWPGYLAPFGVFGHAADEGALKGVREAARKVLGAAMSAARIEDAKAVIADGPAAAAVVDFADRIDARLLVVSTHGRTGLARAALGSVAERIVRHADCSVLVVRRRTPD